MIGLGRTSLSLFGMVAVVAAVLASATIWLVLTDPVTVANSVTQGDVSPLVRELASAVYEALRGLLKYLVARALGPRPAAPPYRFPTRNFVST